MDINKISLKSLVLFYLRWEKDNDKLDKLKLSVLLITNKEDNNQVI